MPSLFIPPDSIELPFVPFPSAELTSRLLGDEMVLVDRRSGMVHTLNPSAALIWQCFDGEADLAEIAADLADVVDAPHDIVAGDVLAMTRAAGRAGLLEGVREADPVEDSHPRGMTVGDHVILPGLITGTGRKSLLVNWSSGCGFCMRILPFLAALRPALGDSRTDLVILDGHGGEDTRTVLDEHGLNARLLVREDHAGETPDPFPGMGTPVAYLLDEEGRVEAPLAYGADEVVRLAKTAAGREPDQESPIRPGGPRFLPVGAGACGPGRTQIRPRRWQPTGVYSVGGYQVGIRANSPAAEQALAAILASYRMDSSAVAPDNFSLVLSAAGSGSSRDLNLLLAGDRVVARSRSPRRVLRALIGRLSCLFDPEPGVVRLDAVPALIDGLGVVLPSAVATWLERLQAPLARLGVALTDESFAHVDLVTAELVVTAPRVQIDEQILDALPEPASVRSEPEYVPCGRYPLKAWLLPLEHADPKGLSPAWALARALGAIAGTPEEVAEAVGPLTALFDRLEVDAVSCEDHSALIRSLCQWCRSRFSENEESG